MSEMQQITSVQKEPIKKEHMVLMALTLFLGILFDILFYNGGIGISYPIFVCALYGVFLWYMRKDLRPRADFGWMLIVPSLMLSMTYFLHSNIVLLVLNFLAIPLLLLAHTLLVTNNNKYQWYDLGMIGDILSGIFLRCIGNAFQSVLLLIRIPRKKDETRKNSDVKKVLIGLLLATPLIVLIIALLASADKVFESYVEIIPDFLTTIKIGRVLSHASLILFVFTIFFGYIWSLTEKREKSQENPSNYIKSDLKVLDPVIVMTIIAVIDFVYLLFTVIQFSYLFGGAGLPMDLTYSEYARQGFFELLTVALINFSILLGCLSYTRKRSEKTDVLLRILNTVLVGSTFVMLCSAYYRMSMYENAYGFTYLRVFTKLFMIFLSILLLMALYRIWNVKFTLAKPYIIASILAFTIVNYINVDVIIAKSNVDRYFTTGKIDIDYLKQLSYDVVPQMARLLDSDDVEVTKGVSDALYHMRLHLSQETPWQSFNVSRFRAQSYLEKLHLEPLRLE